MSVERRVPKAIRSGARSRQSFPPEGYDELTAASFEERRSHRLAELDRATGRVELPVPAAPDEPWPRGRRRALPPAPGAVGGVLKIVRGAWIAKYNPTRAERERHLDPSDRTVDRSDVFSDFSWADPGRAIGDPWIHSWRMRGAGSAIPSMDIGDLVFAVRTAWMARDVGWLHRRTIVGVWFVEATATWPVYSASGRLAWLSEAASFPLRRFDFPVPVKATSDIDGSFDSVQAFHDRSRKAVIQLTPSETLAVARACGLPAAVLTEPDPDRLAPIVAGLELGPPMVVRRRILAGARAAAHRSAVEKAARDVVVGGLRRARFGVVSTEKERGLGSDLWARAIESTGGATELRIEVKGLSGSSPWNARLTPSELAAATADRGKGSWWLAIVTRALRPDRTERWLSSSEVVSVFTVSTPDGHYAADPSVRKRLVG